MPLAVLPFLVIALVQAGVSMTRVNDFLNCSELDEDAVTHEPAKLPVEMKDGTFKWGEDSPEVLHGQYFVLSVYSNSQATAMLHISTFHIVSLLNRGHKTLTEKYEKVEGNYLKETGYASLKKTKPILPAHLLVQEQLTGSEITLLINFTSKANINLT